MSNLSCRYLVLLLAFAIQANCRPRFDRYKPSAESVSRPAVQSNAIDGQLSSATFAATSASHRRSSLQSACVAPEGLKMCYVLDGTSLSAINGASVQSQAAALDTAVAMAYSQAVSKKGWTGWTWANSSGSNPIIAKNSSACQNAFSSYFCLNPNMLSSYNLDGASCSTVPFVPCYARCLNYQTACLGLTAIQAASACVINSALNWNTLQNSDCFCADNNPYTGSLYDSCSGPCNIQSECSNCPTITGLSTCLVLVGTPLSSSNSSMSAQAEAFALDTFVANAYTTAISSSGWNWAGHVFKAVKTPACATAFSSYFCMNPLILANFSLSGSCGVTPPTVFTPCYQRCIAYQTACAGQSMAAASTQCNMMASAGWNTPSNANCYCADNFPFSGSPYDACSGNCNSESECGTCPLITQMSSCYVLTGTAASAMSSSLLPQAQAFAVDAFIASAYANASTPSGWTWGGQTMTLTPSDACRTAFTSYFCLSPQVLGSYGLSLSCGVSSPTMPTPCYERCFSFQTACLGLTSAAASTQCASSVALGLNTASNANCLCADNSPTSGSPYDDCAGLCDAASECSAAYADTCVAPTTLSTCYVLVGTGLSSTDGGSVPAQAAQVDALVAKAFASASSGGGWSGTVGSTAVKNVLVANTTACQNAFASYFCLNPQILAAKGLNGSCGVSAPAEFSACYQRCWNFQTACLRLNATAAAAACGSSGAQPAPCLVNSSSTESCAALGWNTASNNNCICADNFPYSGSPYDVCTGQCSAQSECGTCPTIAQMGTCYVLTGTPLSTSANGSSAQAQAYALDTYIARAYASATSAAGWTWNGTVIKVNASAACATAFSSYFCLNPKILANFSVSGACGVTAPASFTPCLQRCIAYQAACTGLSVAAASAACAGSASSGWNTAGDANCYCGDNSPTTGSPYDTCTGSCNNGSECGSCPTIVGMKACYVLTGTPLSASPGSSVLAQSQAFALDSYMMQAYMSASTSGAGWMWGNNKVSITSSESCKTAFTSYFCLNPQILTTFNLSGVCGVSAPVSFTPCFQRCISYMTLCLGMSTEVARTACRASASSGDNTASNENCYCADNDPLSGSPYDTCSGLCNSNSECAVTFLMFFIFRVGSCLC